MQLSDQIGVNQGDFFFHEGDPAQSLLGLEQGFWLGGSTPDRGWADVRAIAEKNWRFTANRFGFQGLQFQHGGYDAVFLNLAAKKL